MYDTTALEMIKQLKETKDLINQTEKLIVLASFINDKEMMGQQISNLNELKQIENHLKLLLKAYCTAMENA